MTRGNETLGKEFILEGFYDLPQLQVPLFAAFLLIYLLTLAGNLLLMANIYADSRLHTPMYFFLSNLSFLHISYTSVSFPNMLANFFLERARIPFAGCPLQLYFFIAMVCAEFLLLTVMAYDRYVAICYPLQYTSIMNMAVCFKLAAGAWVLSFMESVPHTVLISGFSFCKSHEINHFFCDMTALLQLSCTGTNTIETMNFVYGSAIGMFSFILILVSYINIIAAILRIQSTEGRRKTVSTCASHLTVVILYYGVLLFTYMSLTSASSQNQNKIFSLVYIASIPMCNPLIYTLKNK